MNTNIAAAEILESAAFVIGTGHFAKGFYARNARNRQVEAHVRSACSWCSMGALAEAVAALSPNSHTFNVADDAFREVIGSPSVAEGNDAPERTAAEVEAAMLQTAANLRGEA